MLWSKAVAWCLVGVFILADSSGAKAVDWQAGIARGKITPQKPQWMSGYASRDHGAEGTLIDLWAKALVIQDPAGAQACLITLDLVGIDRDFSRAVCDELRGKLSLERRQIALCTSHTHTGPVVGRTLMSMYFLDDLQRQIVADYTLDLERQLVALAAEAVSKLQPAKLAWGNGHCSVAVNRRNNKEDKVPELRAAGALVGPVDHDVPVLSVRSPEGKLLGIVFGYACHATVLGTYEWSGDYPGFAQIELERLYPEATALFFAGCGADQNPLPRRTVDLAREHGRAVAQSVDAVLRGPMEGISGELLTRYVEIPLALDTLPSREELVAQTESQDRYVKQRATLLLAQIDAGKPLEQTYPYPIQLWQLGTGPKLVTLGGEVTVDYSLRLKRELGKENTWVAAYTNDVMAYIPSLRVLKEGGYEGAGAMVYYGLPTAWSPAVEETIIRTVHELLGEKR